MTYDDTGAQRAARVLKILTALLIIGLCVVAVWAPAAAQESTAAGIGTSTAASGCAANVPAPPAAGQTAFTIVSQESAVRYRAQAELAGQGAAEAVGETTAIIGTILFDAEGNPQACSRFDWGDAAEVIRVDGGSGVTFGVGGGAAWRR